MEPLGCYLPGYLSHPRHPHRHRSQTHGQLPGRVVAIAVAPEGLASLVAVAAQEGVHFFLQHRGQHLLGSFPDVGLQNVLYLGPISLAAVTLTTVTLV